MGRFKWFFEAQGHMAFWYGQVLALVQAGVYSLRDPDWSKDLIDWVTGDLFPNLWHLAQAAGEVLLGLHSSS